MLKNDLQLIRQKEEEKENIIKELRLQIMRINEVIKNQEELLKSKENTIQNLMRENQNIKSIINCSGILTDQLV